VVKVGGGLLADGGRIDAVLAAIARADGGASLLVIPGGGPFADAVREADRRIGLTEDAAHWMAVLAMDQYAELIVARMPGAVLVFTEQQIRGARARGLIPVLAPCRWLRERDPLPHSWDVTSDSIAAWFAGALGARRLVLVKPSGAAGPNLVDPAFAGVASPRVAVAVVPADDATALRAALARDW
jgi:aspartokinase-like uncharacterized kinase